MSEPFVGEIRLFGFPKVPNGWLPCDGSKWSISVYEDLFTLIGTIYGGDGVTTFAVPNLAGRVPLHYGTGTGLTERMIGEIGGSENVTLLPSQIPSHGHAMNATTSPATESTISTSVELGALTGDTLYVTDTSGSSPFITSPASTGAAGYTSPHDNTMPTLAAQFCIAWAGIYPSPS